MWPNRQSAATLYNEGERMLFKIWLAANVVILVLQGPALFAQDKGKQEQPKALTAAPAGFDVKRDGAERGKLELREYDSTIIGIKRKTQVYTPPAYSKDN